MRVSGPRLSAQSSAASLVSGSAWSESSSERRSSIDAELNDILAAASVSDSARSESSSERRSSIIDVELNDILGKGSYGVVWSASHTQLGEVAVKVLPWNPNETMSSDLKKELRLLQACKSEYIVRSHGVLLKCVRSADPSIHAECLCSTAASMPRATGRGSCGL